MLVEKEAADRWLVHKGAHGRTLPGPTVSWQQEQ